MEQQQTPVDLFAEAHTRVMGAWRLLPDESRTDLKLLADVACEVILMDMLSKAGDS